MSRARWLATLGVVLALLVAARGVAAQEQAAAVSRSVVHVNLVASLGGEPALSQRIASWFDAERFDVSVRGVAYLQPRDVLRPAQGALVEAWVARQSPMLLRLYFASPEPTSGKTRYLLRDLTLEQGLDEVGAEELSQAVHLSALALIENQSSSPREQVEASLRDEIRPPEAKPPSTPPVTLAQPAIERAAPPPQAPLRQPSSVVSALAIGYSVAYAADEGVPHGPRLRAQLRWPGGFGAVARLDFALPRRSDLSALRLDLWSGSAALAVTQRIARSRSWLIEGFFGPALLLQRYAPQAKPEQLFDAGPAASELRPQLLFGILFATSEHPRWAFVPELDVALKGSHYEARRDGRPETVARAPRFVPRLGVEVEF